MSNLLIYHVLHYINTMIEKNMQLKHTVEQNV